MIWHQNEKIGAGATDTTYIFQTLFKYWAIYHGFWLLSYLTANLENKFT